MATQSEEIKERLNAPVVEGPRTPTPVTVDGQVPPGLVSKGPAIQKPTLPEVLPSIQFTDREHMLNTAKSLNERGPWSADNQGGLHPELFLHTINAITEFNRQNPVQFSQQILDDPIVTSPVPGTRPNASTGRFIENKGREFTTTRFVKNPDIDSEQSIRNKLNRDGISTSTGLSFWKRFRLAISSDTPGNKTSVLLDVMQDVQKTLPPGVPLFTFDAQAGEVLFPRKITQDDVDAGEDPNDIGKFRMSVLDEDQWSLADFGDMVDPQEIGSIVGAVLSIAPQGKGLGFFVQSARTAGLAFVGREAGEVLGLATDFFTTGRRPDLKELIDQGWEGAKLEALVSFFGLGAEKVIRAGVSKLSAAELRIANAKRLKEGRPALEIGDTGLTDAELIERNVGRDADRQALFDMEEQLQLASDRKVFRNRGEAEGNLSRVIEDKSRLQLSPAKSRRDEQIREIRKGDQLDRYLDEVLGGNSQIQSQRGEIIVNARDAVHDGSRIALEASQDGNIMLYPKVNPDASLTMSVMSDDALRIDQVANFDDFGLKGIGLGEEVYEAAARTAQEAGVPLRSGVEVSEDAFRQWEILAEKEGMGPVTRHPNARQRGGTSDQADLWLVLDADGNIMRGESVFEMSAAPADFTEQLLKTAKEPVDEIGHSAIVQRRFVRERADGGQFERAEPLLTQFERLRLFGTTTELGALEKQLSENTILKSKFVKELHDNMIDVVNVDGALSRPAFKEWLDESARLLDKVFDAEELALIHGSVGGLRAVQERLTRLAATKASVLANLLELPGRRRILSETGEDTLEFLGSNIKVMKALKNLQQQGSKAARGRWKRAIALLKQNPAEFEALQGLVKTEFKEELKRAINSNMNPRELTSFQAQFDPAQQRWIREFFPESAEAFPAKSYFGNLNTFFRVLRMDKTAAGVSGVSLPKHGSLVQFVRTIMFKDVFGRRQRAFSAGQSLRRELLSQRAMEIVADPNMLRQLMPMLANDSIFTKKAWQVMARLGLLEPFGYDVRDFEVAARRQEVLEYMQTQMADFEDAAKSKNGE